jgi:N-acetylglucosamine-6-phosphate deacetylase
MTTIRAAKLFDGTRFTEARDVLLEGGRIAALRPTGSGAATTLPDGAMLVPGFVDLQVNGGGGLMLNDAPTAERMRHIAHAHARAGSTTILPTLISGTRDAMAATLAAGRQALADHVPGVAGVHLEGPFLAISRRGIHPAARMTVPSEADIAALCEPFPGRLLVTLAPEMVAPEIVARLVAAGVIVFAGHTDGTFEQVRAGLDAGISGFTHLYNAMSPLTGRGPGAVGAALDHPSARAGIIADGLHVHAASIRVALRCLGPERLFLVSDAMATAASEATQFEVYGIVITLKDGRLTDANGTLAGAHLTMGEAVATAVRDIGIALDDALRMATSTPAETIGRTDLGRIAKGAAADLVALDRKLQVVAVWQGGARIV